jgi:hypothetical protein
MVTDLSQPLCPSCGNKDTVFPPDLLISLEIGPNYSIELPQRHFLHHSEEFSKAEDDLVKRVVDDYIEGRLTSNEILERHNKGIFTSDSFVARCEKCSTQFHVRREVQLWIGYRYHGAFWSLSRKWIDEALKENLGISLQDAASLTKRIDPSVEIATSFHTADPVRYERLKDCIGLAERLPKGKGGDELRYIVSTVLLSLLTSAIYDATKAGGKSIIRSLRASLRNWKIRRRITSIIKDRNVERMMEKMNQNEIEDLVGSSEFARLSYRKKLRVVQMAVRSQAKSFRRRLLVLVKGKGGHITSR